MLRKKIVMWAKFHGFFFHFYGNMKYTQLRKSIEKDIIFKSAEIIKYSH